MLNAKGANRPPQHVHALDILRNILRREWRVSYRLHRLAVSLLFRYDSHQFNYCQPKFLDRLATNYLIPANVGWGFGEPSNYHQLHSI